MTAPDTTVEDQAEVASDPKTYVITKTVLVSADSIERAAKIARNTRVPSRFVDEVLDIREAVSEVTGVQGLDDLDSE